MDIDLTKLDSLFNASYSDKNKPRDTMTPIEDKPASIRLLEPPTSQGEPKYLKIEKAKEIQDKTAKVYEEYQNNIRKSERLRSELLKDIQLGGDPYNLLLKAVDCIATMTGERHYYTQAKEDLQAIYTALGHKAPAQEELEELELRLDTLIQALEQSDTPNERIYRAIKKHEERKEQLLKIIS